MSVVLLFSSEWWSKSTIFCSLSWFDCSSFLCKTWTERSQLCYFWLAEHVMGGQLDRWLLQQSPCQSSSKELRCWRTDIDCQSFRYIQGAPSNGCRGSSLTRSTPKSLPGIWTMASRWWWTWRRSDTGRLISDSLLGVFFLPNTPSSWAVYWKGELKGNRSINKFSQDQVAESHVL